MMRINPVGRVIKNSVLKGAAGQRAADALTRGIKVAGQVGASTSEFLRVRRDPTEAAIRRKRAARRRFTLWGIGSALGIAAGAALTVNVVHGGFNVSLVLSITLTGALLIWCLLGLVRSGTDLRRRSAILATMPPPQPARRLVASAIRSEVNRLDRYSDGLRDLIWILPAPVRSSLSTEVIGCADEAERLLRRQAQEFTVLHESARGAPASARPTLKTTADALSGRIHEGVERFGQLVAAATDTVAASTELSSAIAELQPATDRLSALAIGMREIAEQARPS